MVTWAWSKKACVALAWLAHQNMATGYIVSSVLYSKALKDPLVRASPKVVKHKPVAPYTRPAVGNGVREGGADMIPPPSASPNRTWIARELLGVFYAIRTLAAILVTAVVALRLITRRGRAGIPTPGNIRVASEDHAPSATTASATVSNSCPAFAVRNPALSASGRSAVSATVGASSSPGLSLSPSPSSTCERRRTPGRRNANVGQMRAARRPRSACGLGVSRQAVRRPSYARQPSLSNSFSRSVNNAGDGTSPTRSPRAPAPRPKVDANPDMIASPASESVNGAQDSGDLYPRSQVIDGDAGDINGSVSNRDGGGGLLDWAFWPLWGTIDACKWAGGTLKDVAVAPVIRLASPRRLAGWLFNIAMGYYTPQRARDFVRVFRNLGVNAAGLVASPAGQNIFRSTERTANSLSIAASSPAGRKVLLESATALVKFTDVIGTSEARNFIRQGALVTASVMDALASDDAHIFLKDVADLVVRFMEGANSSEAIALIAEFTADFNHVLEMENMAGIERRAAGRTATHDFAGINIRSTSREAFDDYYDCDQGPCHFGRSMDDNVDDDTRGTGNKVENNTAVSGGTPIPESPERRTRDSVAGEEKTMEDLVREVRQERDRREGCRKGGGFRSVETSRRAEHDRGGSAENSRGFEGRKGGCTRDIDAGADTDRNKPGTEKRITRGQDGNGINSATASTRDARSNPEGGAASSTAGGTAKFSTAGALQDSPSPAPSLEARTSSDLGAGQSGATTDGSRLDADDTWDCVSDASAAGPTMATGSRAGTGGRAAESGGGGSAARRDRPMAEYERDGIALLPRFRPADIVPVLKGPPADPAMSFESPNQDSFDDRVARALNSRSPNADIFGGGTGDVREVEAELMGAASVSGRGQEARDMAAVRDG